MQIANWLLRAVVPAGILLSLVFAAPDAVAQASKHTVRGNETIDVIAKKYQYPSVSLSQMIYALVFDNTNAFERNSMRQLTRGYEIAIPAEDKVKAIDAAMADREVVKLRQADAIYRQGVAAEQASDRTKAVRFYLTAAQMGHGLADLRLGQLYDRDTTGKIPRDLAESIRFYRAARKQGLKVDGPLKIGPTWSDGSGN